MSYQEIRDRVYKVTVHLGYDLIETDDGKVKSKRITSSKTFDLSHLSREKAEKQIIIEEDKYASEAKGNPVVDRGMTFRTLSKLFMEQYAALNLRPKTIKSYSDELDSKILPEFGYMTASEIHPLQLTMFYNKLAKTTYKKGSKNVKTCSYSARTIYYQHQIISSIFNWGIEMELLAKNPCKAVKPPRPKKSQKINKAKQWNAAEAINFLCFIEEAPLKYLCAIELLLVGNMRTEEVLGLDIDDVQEKGVSIHRTSKLVGKEMIVEELAKNDPSERFVTLPKIVVNDLKKLRTEQKARQFKLQKMWGDIKKSDGKPRILLLTQADGKPMHGKTIYHWFKKQIAAYNRTKPDEEKLKDIPPHGLRHTGASLITLLGFQARAGSARLGHALASTFLNMYGAAQDIEDEMISESLGGLLLQNRKQEDAK
ncbi:MAG: tyrosine-type recombinase/integrase [Eubacteriales bacterium]|nr:tyrosine-type recombinase/integrase [Eubacteriales bacterium]